MTVVNKRSQHASGVILYNNDPWETNAIMRSPSGDLTTQFALHESEWLGDIKYDFLLTEISDKIINCVGLLQKNGYFEENATLREIYNKYLHPEAINLKDKKLWDALSEGNVLDVFQFSTDVGLAIAKLIKPNSPMEMTACNALMRLMSEKGQERPMDRYARMKGNLDLWYEEMKMRGLTKKEVEILEPYYKHMYGTPCMQEDLMQVVMDENISNFSLKESNDTRKIVAKKQMKRIPELKEKFFSQCPNENFAQYIWDTVVAPQLG